MDIQRIAVIGAGTMGNGIAQTFAMKGCPVTLVDISDEALGRGLASIERSLDWFEKKGGLGSDERRAIRARIETATDVAKLSNLDLVVEAIFEDEALKKKVLAGAEQALSGDGILASNTSSISITRLAAATKRPPRVIGMHFMNPVPRMELVEIIRGAQTDPEVVATIVELARKLGKTPAESEDYPGFLANRILMPMINEAIYSLMEGVGTREAIDTVMKLGMNHPMGPLTLADFIGLDVCLAIMEVLHHGLGDPKYRPCPLLRKMVAAGYLGRKSGRGFYDYAAAPQPVGAR
jgi:3-hydroxybutyryl-CoA dehydrogenase